MVKIYQLKSDKKNKSIKALQMWCYLFLDRNDLSFRALSHEGQPSLSYTIDKVYTFLKQKITIRKFRDLNDLAECHC